MGPLYQKIEIKENCLFIGKSNIIPNFDGLFHFHPEYELTLINEGQGNCLIGDKLVSFKKGDLFLLGPSLPHAWTSDFKQKGMSHSVVIQLHQDRWKGAFLEGKELRTIVKMFEDSNRGILFKNIDSEAVFNMMSQIVENQQTLAGLLKILSLLGDLSENKQYQLISSVGYHPAFRGHDFEKINKVYHYVQEQFGNDITIEILADLTNMTKSGFCRYFKKITQRTFVSYLNEYRIGVACRLLQQKDLSMSEICFESGYQSISNFNKQFKINTGFSPRTYKRRLYNIEKPPVVI